MSCCNWTPHGEDDVYQTQCGHAWSFEAGGPVENGANYCPYCGRGHSMDEMLRADWWEITLIYAQREANNGVCRVQQ
jgi:hypothetical protein